MQDAAKQLIYPEFGRENTKKNEFPVSLGAENLRIKLMNWEMCKN